jgi:hypothetical protein
VVKEHGSSLSDQTTGDERLREEQIAGRGA